MIEINTPDYQVAEVHTGQGPADSNLLLSDDPDSIPIARWALNKYKAHLLEFSELLREASEA